MLNCIFRGYKAWRIFDTKLIVMSKMIAGTTKVQFSPAKLIKVFGPPSFNEFIEGTSTVFNFEDSNLDYFKILDRHQVKEFIDPNLMKLKHPPYSHRGKSENLPTIKEFWKMEESAEFWIEHTDYADIDAFVKFLNETVEKDEDAAERVIKKFGEVEHTDIYGKNYQISRDYAVFRYNKMNWD